MALLKRELYRQVKGPEITHADRCTLVFDTDIKSLYVEHEVVHLETNVRGAVSARLIVVLVVVHDRIPDDAWMLVR